MARIRPAARIRLLDAITTLQRLRREMARLLVADEDLREKNALLKPSSKSFNPPHCAKTLLIGVVNDNK
jgi:hypothetical protein